MSRAFLLLCECGQSVVIRPTQAGHTVRCTCGRELVAPTMREIRHLPEATDSDTPLGQVATAWPVQFGILFAVGMVIAVAALGSLAYFGWQRSRVLPYIKKPPLDNLEFNVPAADLAPAEAWDIWVRYRDTELGQRRPPWYLLYRKTAEKLAHRMKVAAVVAVLGLVIAAAAVGLGQRFTVPRSPT